MATLNYKVSGAWTPIAGDVNATNPINDFISQNTPGPWTAITLVNSWVNYGATYQPARYRKIGDIVYIEGMIKQGVIGATPFATLPVGFRPVFDRQFGTVSANNFGMVQVSSNGTMLPITGNAANLSLDGILFSTL